MFQSRVRQNVEIFMPYGITQFRREKFFLMDTIGETLLKPALARKAVKHCKKTRDKYLVQLDE